MGMGKLLDKIAKFFVPESIPWFAANLYEKVARKAIANYFRVVAKEITLKIDSGKILDIGTGPGFLPIEIAKIAPELNIDGIDKTRKMIKKAKRNAGEVGVGSQLHFEVGDINNLRFKDNSYDMVISTGAFHSWKNPVKAINECYRVLKPGKEAWIYDPAKVGSSINARSRESLKGLDRFALKWSSWASKFQIKVYTIKEVQQVINKTKFEDYDVEKKDWVRIRLRKK